MDQQQHSGWVRRRFLHLETRFRSLQLISAVPTQVYPTIICSLSSFFRPEFSSADLYYSIFRLPMLSSSGPAQGVNMFPPSFGLVLE